MNSPSPDTKSAHRPPVNVTFQIEDEPVHQAPSLALTIAFGLSFIPALGVLGGGYAGWDLWSSARQKVAAHGLAYAAIAIQLLYIVLGITLYIVVFQLPLQNNSSLSDPAVHVGQEFLQAVKNGDKDRVASLVDPSIVGALQNNLAPYQSSIRYNPQMVLAETFSKPQYADTTLAAYNGHPSSFQMWRVSTDQTTSHYYVLTVAEDATGNKKVIGMLGFDASGEDTARTLARKNRNSTFNL